MAFARLWQVEIDEAGLDRLARRLGADVPFCLRGGTMLGTARGDELRPLPDLPTYTVMVVKPQLITPGRAEHRAAAQTERHVRAEPPPQPIETGLVDLDLPQPRERHQRRRRVRASAAQPGLRRNALVERDDRIRGPVGKRRIRGLRRNQTRRLPDQIGAIERHARIVAAQLERPRPRLAHERVVQRERLQHGHHIVIAVRALPENLQVQVDLGERLNSDRRVLAGRRRIGVRRVGACVVVVCLRVSPSTARPAERPVLAKRVECERTRIGRHVHLERRRFERHVEIDLREIEHQVGARIAAQTNQARQPVHRLAIFDEQARTTSGHDTKRQHAPPPPPAPRRSAARCRCRPSRRLRA